ncbi:hypothetical protein EJB05_48514, partial [Eragrostis curvula]
MKAATARLYTEMDALGELEASERRMQQWMRHSGPIPAQSAVASPGGKRAPAAAEPGEKLMLENSDEERMEELKRCLLVIVCDSELWFRASTEDTGDVVEL